MGIQERIARIGGDLWRSWRMVALWPYPAVVWGKQRKLFTWDDYRTFTAVLHPGDMLLSRAEPFFGSNRSIPGAFKHCAVYTGAVRGTLRPHGDEYEIAHPRSVGLRFHGLSEPGLYIRTVTHAISEGVLCQDLGAFLFEEDYVVAVRPWLDEDQQRIIVETALAQSGKGYDFDFNSKTAKQFFCTELGYYCCQKASCSLPGRSSVAASLAAMLIPIWGKRTQIALADDFVADHRVVAVSSSCKRDRIHRWSHRDLEGKLA